MSDTLKPIFLPVVKPSDLPALALAMARSGLALMLYGSPGIGKTSLIQAMGRDAELLAWSTERSGQRVDELPVVTLSAPELNVEDLLGVPTVEELVRGDKRRKVTRWATPALLDPDHPFILFIDEPNRCEPSVRNALFQLITGRTTSGGFALPAGSLVCMAGNRIEDRAGVRSLDTAFTNRCGHFELAVDPEAWLDWASRQEGFSPMVRAFVGRHPHLLNKFDPKCAVPQQATPRTWAGLGLSLDRTPAVLQQPLIHGLLGTEVTQLYRAFQAHADVVPTVDELVSAPERIMVPTAGQLDKAWIFATAMGDHLSTEAKVPAGRKDPLGHAAGIALGRLAKAGFEEVTVFALRRAWRRAETSRLGKSLPNLRFFTAVQTLSQIPTFAHFLNAMHQEGLV
jgi:hypothetical protein